MKVPGNLYFLGDVAPGDDFGILANAKSTPLGPLLPVDQNTLLNALQKGLAKNTSIDKKEVEDLITYTKHVFKLSQFAINTSVPKQKFKILPVRTGGKSNGF